MHSHGTKGRLPHGNGELAIAKNEAPARYPNLKTMYAGELFCKLSDKNQDAIIMHIKSLLDSDIK
jgi:hypothetical protein